MGAERSRRLVLAASGALAASLGAGVAWLRWREQAPSDSAIASLWQTTLHTVDGVPHPLSQWRGQHTLINFWATWCPPCVEEMPMFDAFYRQHSARRVILGLAIDRADAVRTFLQQHRITYPILIAGASGLQLGASLGNVHGGLPFSVFLQPSGQVAQTKIGKIAQQDLQDWLS